MEVGVRRLPVLAVVIGFLLDLLIGDPENWWHPVRGIGCLIEYLETKLRKIFPATPKGELVAGGILAAAVLFVVWGISEGILLAARQLHPLALLAVMSIMSWQVLAAKSLKTESMKVYYALLEGNLHKARSAVSMIVGRDTKDLPVEGVIKAAVETVAENTSDGVIAPLFYLLVFGPAGAFIYKAVNTMDSMVGYKNPRYLYFGRVAAKLDDWANWLPSRLAALLMIGTAWLLPGFDGAGAWRIWRRDRRCHKSPNSAQGEAACAGALGIRLAGDAFYFGVLQKKPTIGDDGRPALPEDIPKANLLMYGATLLALAAGLFALCCNQ